MKYFKGDLPEVSLKYKTGSIKRCKIQSSHDAAEILREMYDADLLAYQESFVVLYLNNANNTIAWQKLSSGGMTGAIVDTRMLFASALSTGATCMIISHNHPSGSKTPSQADKTVTRRIQEAGKIMEIKLLDHIIITDESWLSMTDEGLM